MVHVTGGRWWQEAWRGSGEGDDGRWQWMEERCGGQDFQGMGGWKIRARVGSLELRVLRQSCSGSNFLGI